MASNDDPVRSLALTHNPGKYGPLRKISATYAAASAVLAGFTSQRFSARKAHGFRLYHCLEIALYPTLGQLPEPKVNHRFC